MYETTDITVDSICEQVGVSKATLYRHMRPSRGHLNKGRKYPFSLERFKEESPSKYYWMGFISADGSINSSSLAIELASTDEEHLEKFLEWCKSNSPITRRVNNGGHEASKVSIHSRELVGLFEEMGMYMDGRKTTSTADFVPEEFLGHYIRGYVDGDGSVSFHKSGQIYLSVSSNSLEIVQTIRDFVSSKNKIQDYKTYYRFTTLGNNRAVRALDLIYKNSTKETRLDRKYNNYLLALAPR